MRDYLFTANEKNAFDLQKEYNLSDYDTGYIERMFWPIIVLTDISVNEFQKLLNKEKEIFIKNRKKFVVKLFKRDYLEFLIYELREYLDNINKGKNKLYYFLNGTYFHWFKLELDTTSYTLLLSNKNEIDLEIYFNDILGVIELFILENETLQTIPQQNENNKELVNENLILPPFENSIIVHYGCSDFNSTEHKVYWIGAISHKPNKTYFFESKNEVEVIEKFERYIQDNKDKTFIHWSMNSPKFGFRAIESRYFELTNNNIDFDIKNEIDLSEFLKNKYGINYIDRKNGRLNNLAILNNFSGIQSEVEVININDATNRLELIYSIVQAEIQGNLKTLQPQPVQETVPPKQKEFAFENNFDLVNSNEVYNYFSEKLVSKRMLNENELQEYLIQAFQELTPPKKLFKLKNINTKQKVNKVFYNYFKDVAQKPHGKRKAYAELLGEYFEGFKTENVMTNWSK